MYKLYSNNIIFRNKVFPTTPLSIHLRIKLLLLPEKKTCTGTLHFTLQLHKNEGRVSNASGGHFAPTNLNKIGSRPSDQFFHFEFVASPPSSSLFLLLSFSTAIEQLVLLKSDLSANDLPPFSFSQQKHNANTLLLLRQSHVWLRRREGICNISLFPCLCISPSLILSQQQQLCREKYIREEDQQKGPSAFLFLESSLYFLHFIFLNFRSDSHTSLIGCQIASDGMDFI